MKCSCAIAAYQSGLPLTLPERAGALGLLHLHPHLQCIQVLSHEADVGLSENHGIIAPVTAAASANACLVTDDARNLLMHSPYEQKCHLQHT